MPPLYLLRYLTIKLKFNEVLINILLQSLRVGKLHVHVFLSTKLMECLYSHSPSLHHHVLIQSAKVYVNVDDDGDGDDVVIIT